MSLGLAAVLASLPIRLNSGLRTLVRLARLAGLVGLARLRRAQAGSGWS